MCDANNARRNRMWTIFCTKIKCGNIELQVCHQSNFVFVSTIYGYVVCDYIDFYPIFVYLFISFLFDRFVPISFGGCVCCVCRVCFVLVTSAIASCFCFDLMLQRMYSNWIDDGISRFSIVRNPETKNEMQRMKEIFFFAETSSSLSLSSLLSSVCISHTQAFASHPLPHPTCAGRRRQSKTNSKLTTKKGGREKRQDVCVSFCCLPLLPLQQSTTEPKGKWKFEVFLRSTEKSEKQLQSTILFVKHFEHTHVRQIHTQTDTCGDE